MSKNSFGKGCRVILAPLFLFHEVTELGPKIDKLSFDDCIGETARVGDFHDIVTTAKRNKISVACDGLPGKRCPYRGEFDGNRDLQQIRINPQSIVYL